MDKIYIEKEEFTSLNKQPKKALIESILNFSKSYQVKRSKHVGQLEIILN